MSPLIKPSSNSVKGRKCCHQSALKRLASIMNEVRHPSEVMCVLETNLICSRMGHSLSHQHFTIPTRLLYVITSKDQHSILSRPAVHHSDNCANIFSMQSRECALNTGKIAQDVKENVCYFLAHQNKHSEPNVSPETDGFEDGGQYRMSGLVYTHFILKTVVSPSGKFASLLISL